MRSLTESGIARVVSHLLKRSDHGLTSSARRSASSAPRPGLLHGVRVLDLSRVLAGPWCTQLLADYGAEVIKVEEVLKGDDTRSWGPPFVSLASSKNDKGKELEDGQERDQRGRKRRRTTEESAYFLCANRGKRSIAVNIKTEEGQDIIRRLVASADVLVENFKVGGLARYGLDYESLKAVNPVLIYCSITEPLDMATYPPSIGFGQTGPLSHRAGYDAMIQGMSGLMSITGESEGSGHTAGGGPQKVGVAVADLFTGLYASSAVLAALFRVQREKLQSSSLSTSGPVEGEHIDLSLLDTQIAALANQAMNCLMTGEPPRRMGTAHPNIVPYRSVPVKDGNIMLAVGNDDQFRKFCEVLGQPAWAQDERFATNAARVAHRKVLDRLIDERMKERKREDWIMELEKKGVPCGPINDIKEALAEPQVQHRQLVKSLPFSIIDDDEQGGKELNFIGNPVKFSGHPISYVLPPPRHGEHTAQVLGELLGLIDDDLTELERKGIVGIF